jgi:hypothetical protein
MKTSTTNQKSEKESGGTLRICLFAGFSTATHGELKGAITGVKVTISKQDEPDSIHAEGVTGQEGQDAGCVNIPLECGTYIIGLPPLPKSWGRNCWPSSEDDLTVEVRDCKRTKKEYFVPSRLTGLGLNVLTKKDNCDLNPCSHITRGKPFWLQAIIPNDLAAIASPQFFIPNGDLHKAQKITESNSTRYEAMVGGTSGIKGPFTFGAEIPLTNDPDGPAVRAENEGDSEADEQIISGHVTTTTTLTRTETSFTEDTAFWTAIRNGSDALSFNNYLSFMDWIFCGGEKPLGGFEAGRFPAKQVMYRDLRDNKRFLPFTDSDAYRVVKAATEAFVMVNCGVLKDGLQPFDPDRDNAYLDRRDLPLSTIRGELSDAFNNDYLVSVNGNGSVLPYLAVIRKKLPDIPIKSTAFENTTPRTQGDQTTILDNCFGILQDKLDNPCLLELIWSYWHEEGMLVQSMSAITRRFQNVRSSAQDPLANLEMDPLRPLNNIFWGYIQDEQHRLTVGRRNYEYDHHYGLRLEGKAVQNFRPVDTRSKFLEAFHHLLRLCTVFYKQDDDTTVKADAFPVLNALKEVHLILSQGAHNQFGDLPSTARIEMLMQQWLLARPEFREFLPTRIMVAYPEPWMDRVDAMKKLQGWTDTSVLHFRNLGMFGEQLLLSIRWGHWSDEFEPVKALNWARFFRPQAQGYIHAYRAATGVDLSADPTVNASVDSTLPSVLLQKRLATQQRAS